MMGFPAWVGADHCTDGPQPGVEAFAAAVLDMRRFEGIYNLGIYNCRSVRGGSTTSLHGEGRAWDAGHPEGAPVGRELLHAILKRPGRLGVQCVIHERRIYSRLSPEGRPYDGVDPHTTHLHIEFTWKAAKNLSKATVLEMFTPEHHRPGERILRTGTRGPDVRWVQTRLGLDADGIFGPATVERVRRFERRQDFRHPNGVVQSNTWKALGVTPRF